MKRAVIIAGGTISNYNQIKKEIMPDDLIICADSGYDHAVKMQIKADIIIGDFDSIKQTPPDIKIIRYPTKKDKTDTEIAIDYAREQGIKNFLLLAATGTRMDHTLTNILLLKEFLQRKEYAEIVDEHNKIMLIDSVIHLNEPQGSIVSLVPIVDCKGVTTHNLEYPLNKSDLYVGKGRGVSNKMLGDKAVVSLDTGLLLVIIAKD